jgi:hypothetical protein
VNWMFWPRICTVPPRNSVFETTTRPAHGTQGLLF